MQDTIIDLCSSPVLKNSPSQTQDQSLPDTNNSKATPNTLSFDWCELSSEVNSREGDLKDSHVNTTSLSVNHSISHICQSNLALKETIHIISDEEDESSGELPVLASRYTTRDVDEKRYVEINVDSNKAIPSSDSKKQPRIRQILDLDFSELSDPFISSSPKRRRVTSSPASLSILSSAIQETNPCSKTDTEPSHESSQINKNGISVTLNQTDFGIDDPKISSSPSVSIDLANLSNKKKKSPPLFVSDSDSDDAWIRELVDQVEKKKEKAKSSSSKTASDARRRKVTAVLENEIPKNGNLAVSNSCSRSENCKSKSELARDKIEREKSRKAKEQLEQKAEKAKARETEISRKLKEKEEISRQKKTVAVLEQLNKLKGRLQSTSEMIVDIPSSMDEKLAHQVKVFLDGVRAEHITSERSRNLIKWRRKVQAEWNPTKDQWMPVTEHIRDENHIMCVLKFQELTELIRGVEGHDLDAYMLQLAAEVENKKMIFLIEGMNHWLGKNKAMKNKEFINSVRNKLKDPAISQNSTRNQRKNPEQAEYIDKNIIDNALLRLHVVYEVLVHHTGTPLETAEWIMRFTQHISSIPYRNQLDNINTSNFCIENGQIDSGKDAKDTYIKMLQQMHLVTPSVAWGIEAKYPNIQTLISGLEREGPLALERCHKCANKNGAYTDKRIGQAVSRRVHSVFLGQDSLATEI
ncbi:Crossover junction endonuclease eme1 [Golovinomyces cichoracearum]|uniref:Crossover junction endonuclease eme1 n=1 Tax=Golovinomyces cichoracearum TaxID=62708 RepID=A0A420J7T1_9PEZI|nr:Crossover junction endonuclease eme1 [Golovinomyces cichoracearum]